MRRRRWRARLCQLQAKLELWWARHVMMDDPHERAHLAADHARPSNGFAMPAPRVYQDGTADIEVDDLGDGWDAVMADLYLVELHHPARREQLG